MNDQLDNYDLHSIRKDDTNSLYPFVCMHIALKLIKALTP